jgi:hypothetical protein
MSKIEVNQISSQCGSTLTIGQSGDTVTLACGATQSGFGRSGSVNWDTTAKTASFTAVSGNGYFVNTTSGAVTMTLPASPSAGDIVAVKDYAQTFNTNNLTIGRNGSPINGANSSDPAISTNGASITFVYVDGTQGWVPTQDDSSAISGIEPYVTATGGTVTTCGDYKIHTFTSPGTFCVTSGGTPLGSNTVDYLVVAGGGGACFAGGGGGGVRFTNSTYTIGCAPAAPRAGASAISVLAQAYPITVGGGGALGTGSDGARGSNSIFSTITSTGGGGGGKQNGPGCAPSSPGGSGGGGQSVLFQPGCNQGAGNTPPVSPPQGTPGGTSSAAEINAVGTGGGGGFMAAGGNGSSGPEPVGGSAGAGGAGGGFPSAFGTSGENCGSYYYFGGGGGGGAQKNPGGGPSPVGGIGGGGAGRRGPGGIGVDGTANTGGGAGGYGGFPAGCGGSGGSGIVIIRYKYQ